MQLVAGPELDARVAEACGVAGKIDYVSPGYGCGHYAFCIGVDEWSPSIDLNAAFEAAEKVGLFGRRCFGSLQFTEPEHRLVIYASNWNDITATGPTPALAICAAILALHPPKEEE